MIDDHDRCEWVNVSSGTGSPRLSWTKYRRAIKTIVCVCVCMCVCVCVCVWFKTTVHNVKDGSLPVEHITRFIKASYASLLSFQQQAFSLTGSQKSSSPVRRRRLASYSSETSLHRSRFQRMSRRHSVFMLVTIAVTFSLATIT